MRVLPRIYRPTLKRWRRTARRWQRYLSVAKTLFGLELLVLVAVWLFTFTGRRAAYIDSWGRRADLLAMLVLAIGFVGLHFTLLITGIAFGLAPALQSSRTDVQTALKDSGNAGNSAQRSQLRGWLVVAEVSAAF